MAAGGLRGGIRLALKGAGGMREPHFNLDNGEQLVFSAAPTEWLKDVVRSDPGTPFQPELSSGNSEGFCRLYAAVLLAERSL